MPLLTQSTIFISLEVVPLGALRRSLLFYILKLMQKKTLFVIVVSLGMLVLLLFTLWKERTATNSKKYTTYTNSKYGYSFEYEKGLELNETNLDLVGLLEPHGGMWVINVKAESTALASVSAWLSTHPRQRKEKDMKVANQNGIVTHYISDEGDVEEEKTTVFIKDGILFEIASRYIDHNKLWQSFQFIQ